MLRAATFAGGVAVAAGHGMMTYPPTRFPNGGPVRLHRARPTRPLLCAQCQRCPSSVSVRAAAQATPGLFPNGSVLWFNQGCSIGCDDPSGDTCSKFKGVNGEPKCCERTMEPTLNSKGAGGPNSDSLSPRTYNDYEIAGAGTIDITKYNPCA